MREGQKQTLVNTAKQKMSYIFCPSYPSLFFALHLKNAGKDIKIITDNVSIQKYCGTAGIDCIYYDYINVPTTRFYKMLALKKRMDKLIQEIGVKEGHDFYLLDNSIDISSFYLAREWAKRSEVYFNVIGRRFMPYKETRRLGLSFVARTFVRCLFKLFLGLDLIFLDVNGNPIWGIDHKFLDRNKIKSLKLDKNLTELTLEVIKKNPLRIKEYDNLIGTDGNLSGVITEESLVKAHEYLVGLPGSFAVKYHPRVLTTQMLQPYEQIMTSLDELPDYIPVELLFGNIKKNVISVYSSLLIAAAKSEHLRAISLLELVKWYSPVYKQEIKDWLIEESTNKIVFVESFEELRKLLEI